MKLLELLEGITYSDIYLEVNTLKLEVEDMDDEYLVNEVRDNFFTGKDIQTIIDNFYKINKLTKKQREKLIGFYILLHGTMELEE